MTTTEENPALVRARAAVSALPGWKGRDGKREPEIPKQNAVDLAREDICLMLGYERWTPYQDIRRELFNLPDEVVNAALREGRQAQAWESRVGEAGSEWRLLEP